MRADQLIYMDPRVSNLSRGELNELLADCVLTLFSDDNDRLSNGAIADALLQAIGRIATTDQDVAKVATFLDEYFQPT
jgi:hypothetical protein